MTLKHTILRLLLNLRQRTSRLFRLIIVCLAAIFGLNHTASAEEFRVDGTNGSCSGDGSNWGASAFKYLQDALNNLDLAAGDEIWVAAGTYYPDRDCANPDGSCDPPPCNRALSFDMISAVEVYGGFFGDELNLEERDIVANETILSGDIDQDGQPDDSDNSEHVVQFLNLMGGDPAILDGFTVRDGYTSIDKAGGGISVLKSHRATIRNCLIEENLSELAGGGVGVNGNTVGDVLEIRNCRFLSNSAGEGGGIGYKFSNGDINIINCEFSLNNASSSGGGLHAASGTVTIVNATFTENTADGFNADGGAADFTSTVDALLINCLFLYNTADDFGGAVYVTGSATAVLENCTLSKNHSDDRGGGIVGNTSIAITITNSVLWGNTDVSGTTNVEQAQIYRLIGGQRLVRPAHQQQRPVN